MPWVQVSVESCALFSLVIFGSSVWVLARVANIKKEYLVGLGMVQIRYMYGDESD